jgi:hypothetical protein
VKLKKGLPIAALLLVGLMSGCNKEQDTTLSSIMGTGENPGDSHLKSGVSILPVVNLGIAGDFAILSKAGITNVYKSAINGDIGSSPITGAAILVSCAEVTGTIYSVDAAGPLPASVTNPTRLGSAVVDMEAAYTDAAGRANPDFINLGAGNISGATLTPGLYKWTTGLLIAADVTISGGPNDVWIFQISGPLNVSNTVKINLAGGAQSKNIFWQVTSSVNLGTTSHFEGSILGQTSVNLLTGASINGRILAQTAVALQMSTVTVSPVGITEAELPTVNTTAPINNAIAVPLNKAIEVTFSEAMDTSTINSSTFTLLQGTTAVAGNVSFTGSKATFTSTSKLENSKIYTGTITTGAKDLAGNALAANYSFSFTTEVAADITLPVVNSTDPVNNAAGVEQNKVIVLNFSEAMNPLTINASTFTLMQGTTAVSGVVSYSGTKAMFSPSVILSSNMEYTATISTGAKDLAGNSLVSSNIFNFKTIVAAPLSGLAVVNLGIAGKFAILSKTGVTDVYKSTITGDVGASPITGGAIHLACDEVAGVIYTVDVNPLIQCAVPNAGMLTTAVSNMEAAYTDAAGRANPDFTGFGAGNIGGKTLTPGLYKWTSGVIIPTDVVISGGPNDVWIFQIAGNLTMSAAMKITLTGGAQAKNIFWVTAGSVTIGTTSHFEGNILGQTGINMLTGATINGRMLAQTAVTLQMNTVVIPQ